MAERDYVSTPVADALGLRGIIKGLADDLEALRDGRITAADAMARAALAKQIWNGCRTYLNAAALLERNARPIPSEDPGSAKLTDGRGP